MKKETSIDKEKIKHLYIVENKSIDEIRSVFKCRTSIIIDCVKSFMGKENLKSLNNHKRKLTKYQVIKILISTMRDGVMQKDIAKKFNVSACNISNICAGRSWKHLFQGAKKKYNKEVLSIEIK